MTKQDAAIKVAIGSSAAPRPRAAGRVIAEHSLVRITEAVANGDTSVPCGTVGTIVFVHEKDDAFEVEFEPPFEAVVSVYRSQIEAV